MQCVSAIAYPNIALIKYWGDLDSDLHIPANSSISMNLAGLFTRVTVCLSPDLIKDNITINGQSASDNTYTRVEHFINRIRDRYRISGYFQLDSESNFPFGAGIASSASAFAALSLAITSACGLSLNETELSRLARLGSGSACRSVPGGFVEWQAGSDHESSYAFSIASPSHWDLMDCITIVDESPKIVSSLEGHIIAATSPLQAARISHSATRLNDCRQAIMACDFDLLARVVELDSNMMHAVMMTSNPPLMYWRSATIAVMQSVIDWRKQGLPVCYTIDAGANVHVLCEAGVSKNIFEKIHDISGVSKILQAKVGGEARIVTDN